MTRFDLEPSTSAASTTRSADAGPASYARQLPEEVDSLATCRPVVAASTRDDTGEQAAASTRPRAARRRSKNGSRQRTVHHIVTLAQTVLLIGKLFRRQRGHQV